MFEFGFTMESSSQNMKSGHAGKKTRHNKDLLWKSDPSLTQTATYDAQCRLSVKCAARNPGKGEKLGQK
jgi:hypothetical protein